jgi:FkbM family methyltransferase
VDGPFQVEVQDGGRFVYVSNPRDSIGRALFWKGIYGDWESETIGVFQALAKNASIVLDIGANTGVYSLLACSVNDSVRVVAFEPVPRIHQLLRQNIKASNFGDRCDARAFAVSNRDGEVDFHVPFADVPTSASMHPEGFRGVAGELIRVPTVTVDTVAASLGQIDLCKIDVEGFEDQVLEGMTETLANDAPSLVFECNVDGPYERLDAILKANGYRLFHLEASGPQPVSAVTPDQTDRARNYLAAKRKSDLEVVERSMNHQEASHP